MNHLCIIGHTSSSNLFLIFKNCTNDLWCISSLHRGFTTSAEPYLLQDRILWRLTLRLRFSEGFGVMSSTSQKWAFYAFPVVTLSCEHPNFQPRQRFRKAREVHQLQSTVRVCAHCPSLIVVHRKSWISPISIFPPLLKKHNFATTE